MPAVSSSRRLPTSRLSDKDFVKDEIVERGSSVVECQTRNQVSPGSNPPFATVSKFGNFRSLHVVPVDSAV